MSGTSSTDADHVQPVKNSEEFASQTFWHTDPNWPTKHMGIQTKSIYLSNPVCFLILFWTRLLIMCDTEIFIQCPYSFFVTWNVSRQSTSKVLEISATYCCLPTKIIYNDIDLHHQFPSLMIHNYVRFLTLV